VLGSALALFRGRWGEQLALKLAHDFALRLDELYQFFITHVVEVAGLADFLLLGEQVQFAARNVHRARFSHPPLL
jgi:hypothetical protein